MDHKHVTVIYEYDLFDALGVDLIADLTPDEYKVEIYFTDGKFSKCIYQFESLYDRAQWTILSLIEQEITRLEKLQEPK